MLENNYFKMRKEFEEKFKDGSGKEIFIFAMLDYIFKHQNDKEFITDDECIYSIYVWNKSTLSAIANLPNIFKKDIDAKVLENTILKLNKLVEEYTYINMPRCIVVSSNTSGRAVFVLEHNMKDDQFNLKVFTEEDNFIKYLKLKSLYEEENSSAKYCIISADDPIFKEIQEPVEETTEHTIRRGRLSLIETEDDSIMTRVKAVNSLLGTYSHRLVDPNIVDFERQEIELKREFLNEFKNIIINNAFRYTNEYKFLVGYIDSTNEYYEVELGADRLPNIFCTLTSEDILKYEIGKFVDNVCNLYFKPIKVFAYMKLKKYENRVVSDLIYKNEAKDEWKEMLYCVYRDFEWVEHLSYKNGPMRE